MKMSAEVNEVFAAFSAFQGEMEDVKRDSKSLLAKYAKLEQVLQVSRKLLASHGLGVTQVVGDCSGENVEIETAIIHKSGQFFSKKMRLATGSIPLNRYDKETLNKAQFVGLNISYARRYGLLAILGMAQEDEDAEVPQHREQKKPDVPLKAVSPVYTNNVNRQAAITKIIALIAEHDVPIERVERIKTVCKVDDIRNLTEEQASSVIAKIKATYEPNIKESIDVKLP